MNIKYITNVRIPTARAQGYAIMKMCEEFFKARVNVELIVPERRSNEVVDDPFLFYGIKDKFPIIKLKSFDLLGPFEAFGKLFYWIDMTSFLISLYFSRTVKDGDVVYTRDFLVVLVISKNIPIYLELHNIPVSNFLFKKAIKKVKSFFVLNSNLKEKLIKMGVPEEKIFISPSGVDIEQFDIQVSKEEARTKLDLPKDKNIILYTGHLYAWKGVDTLAKVAQDLKNTLFIFVGGVEPELTAFKDKYGKYENIVIKPFVERLIIPTYLKSADVLVLPNSSKEEISSKYTSPLKLFEYMASKRPIVSSDLSSIRQILSDNMCVFAKPDDTQSFYVAIDKILSDASLAETISQNAYNGVSKYSWGKRAEKILGIMKN